MMYDYRLKLRLLGFAHCLRNSGVTLSVALTRYCRWMVIPSIIVGLLGLSGCNLSKDDCDRYPYKSDDYNMCTLGQSFFLKN